MFLIRTCDTMDAESSVVSPGGFYLRAKTISIMKQEEQAMQYGYFDNAAREYVITDPRTPMPWANYLGSPEYGAIATQNAGG